MELILASNNAGKIAELKALLPHIRVRTMREAGYTQAIEEPYDSFSLNALEKASTIWKWAKLPVLADDSGLCVDALDDAPGVYSARYAGEGASDADNNQKLLRTMRGLSDRRAYYFAQLCFIKDGSPYYFVGRCQGTIAHEPRGAGGFGYDPVFIPDGYQLTFGEMAPAVKSRLSHRTEALNSLLQSGLLAAY